MPTPDEELRQLMATPREGLDLELKQWIDPKTPEGTAKIAKGCIALRNNNGGRMVIGFKDDGTPDTTNAPADVRVTFHVDVVQEIVSRYSSDVFAVEVDFVTLPSGTYPVISVPDGVRTPVAAKADLPGFIPSKPLVKDHAVYVRSLNSNNIVSSTEARRGDWDRLTRICFDNREADIGGFVRRHLAALNLESLAALVPAFATMLHRPTPTERVVQELDSGRGRYDAVLRARRVQVPHIGTFEGGRDRRWGFPAPRGERVVSPPADGWRAQPQRLAALGGPRRRARRGASTLRDERWLGLDDGPPDSRCTIERVPRVLD